MSYNKDRDYLAEMQAAADKGDYKTAAALEQQRNAKIAGEGLGYKQTSDYAGWLDKNDYGTQLKGLMSSGASGDEVADVLGKRVNKASGTRGMESFAKDDIYDTAIEYIRRQSGTQGAQPAVPTFSYPAMTEYVDGYQKLIDAASQKVLNRAPFSYDAEKDPSYQQYRDSYTRQGNKAMQDTLAEISARTGGLASSYAGQAAQQTYDGYMSALADKQIDLRELAYQKYMDEYNRDRDALSVLTGLSDRDYGRYRDKRGDYDTDKKFAYGQFTDDRDFGYKVGRDEILDSRSDNEWAYRKEQDALDRGDTDRQDARNRISTYLAAGGKAANLDRELIAASGLSAVELASLEQEFARQRGMEDERFELETATSKAALQAKTSVTGRVSGGSSGSSSSSSTKDKYQDKSSNYYRIQKVAADLGDVDEVENYLNRMIDQGYLSLEEAAEMFTLDLGYDPGQLPDMEDVGIHSSGAPITFEELWAAFPKKGRPCDEREFKEAKGRGEAWAAPYKTYQDYLNGMYKRWSEER